MCRLLTKIAVEQSQSRSQRCKDKTRRDAWTVGAVGIVGNGHVAVSGTYPLIVDLDSYYHHHYLF